ncbi:hypothetical protein EVB91_078 [Rhizobium phage RHph_I1_18]|nr:hypothetical protein EVB91_078 [Rhizobium phage RHph_I1_18]
MWNALWFKCLACEGIKRKTKKSYKVVAEGNGYKKELFMCEPCGNVINSLYVTAVRNKEQDE